MAASSPKPPLFLFQVLEDEYAALHGEQPPDLDWQFRANHIIYAESLISRLDLTSFNKPQSAQKDKATPQKAKPPRPQIKATADPDEVAKNALIKYLHDELVRKSFSSSASGAEFVADALNTFLADPNLFAEERFSNYWLNSATCGMRELHTSSTIISGALGFSAGPLTGQDLEHFNRLLFEDAFPHSLKKIHSIRLDAIYQCIHKKKQVALCLSGGGIRSGTFALGLLQGLARHKLLKKFHFLSTVSGGGYIGSWLAAWIHRHPSGLSGVTTDLANKTPRAKVDPDPDPIRFLRRYSSFITPKVGLLSADSWTFIAIYLRNLLLNWMVFIPLLLSVLTLPRFIVSITTTARTPESWTTINTPLRNFEIFSRHFFLAAGFILVVWALAYIMFNRPTLKEELRQASRFWRRKTSQRWFLILCLLPLSVAAFCLTTYWAWSSQNGALPKEWTRFILFGVLVTFLAWFIASYILGRIRPTHITRNWKELFSRDLLYLLVAGAAGGGLLYLLTVKFDPFKAETIWDCQARVPLSALKTELYACFAAPTFLLVFLLGVTLYIGVTSKSTGIDDEDREWWARLSAWVLIAILGWISFTTIVIIGPLALLQAPQWLAPLGGLSGVLAAILGQSARTTSGKSSDGEGGGILDAIMGKALPLLALVFIVFLLALLSLGTTGISQFLANNLPGFLRPFLVSPGFNFNEYLSCIYSNVPGANFYEQTKIAHMNVLHMTSFRLIAILGVLLGLVGLGISLFINLNIFSLHAGYRNRLIRAFLGASRPEHQRKPNPFTGFDPADNVAMHELRPGLFVEDDFPRALALASVLLGKADPSIYKNKPRAADVARYLQKRQFLTNLHSVPDPNTYSIRLVAALRKDLNGVLPDSQLSKEFPDLAETKTNSVKTADEIFSNRAILEKAFGPDWIKPLSAHDEYRLMPVINTTLNLVGGDNLAWQQRKAEPFSISPLHAGCFRLGYRDSRFYGGRDTGGISIGTAAAISGAAASSNMGYYTTSPVLSLVLTFFNVRLGWWLGNPGAAGKDTFELRAPTSSVKPVLEEAFGMTDDENKYVYLTDGGHFENLGIYEMVLRRCHLIIISDAAADPNYNFGDLGNVIRKVRIDLGVPIEFTSMPIFSRDAKDSDKTKGMYWAIGRIRYSCIDGNVQDGLLIYIKPAVYGSEPGDVLEYKKSHPTFPHQSTADQFFDEPQFESYRILGSHVMDQICGSDDAEIDLDQVIKNAVDQLIDASDNGPADKGLEKWFDEWCSDPSKPAETIS
jgi:hypothetical protein